MTLSQVTVDLRKCLAHFCPTKLWFPSFVCFVTWKEVTLHILRNIELASPSLKGKLLCELFGILLRSYVFSFVLSSQRSFIIYSHIFSDFLLSSGVGYFRPILCISVLSPQITIHLRSPVLEISIRSWGLTSSVLIALCSCFWDDSKGLCVYGGGGRFLFSLSLRKGLMYPRLKLTV